MAAFFLLFSFSLVLNVVSQTLQNLPETYSWAGFTLDSSGTYLTAAQYRTNSSSYNGQIYYSQDAGSTWEVSNAPALGYSGIAGSSSGAVLVAIGYFLFPYVSTDYGSTWLKKTGPQSTGSVAISGNGQCMAYVNVDTGISYSSNQGASWSTVGPAYKAQAVGLDSTGTNVVIAVNVVGLYYSGNSGSTFSLQYSDSTVYWTSSIAFSAGSSVYAGTGSSGSILVSTNYGSTWSATQGKYLKIIYLSVDSSGQNVLAIIGFGGAQLYFSTNGGTSFTQLTTGNSNFCVLNGDGNFMLYNYNSSSLSPSSAYSANPNTLDLMPTKSPASAPTTNDCSSSACPTSCPPGYGGNSWVSNGCTVYCTDQPTNGQCLSGGSGCTSSCEMLLGVIAGIVIAGVVVVVLCGYLIYRFYCFKHSSTPPLSKQESGKRESNIEF